MGMFDRVKWVDAAEAPRCASGHAVLEFQSKDRSWPSMDELYVRDGTVYELARRSRSETIVTRDGRLVLEHITDLSPLTGSENLVIYTTCTACGPVISWSREAHCGMRTEYPLQQFRLSISSGAVSACEPIERETTASVYEHHRKLGLHVVPIDSDLYQELLEDSRQNDQ